MNDDTPRWRRTLGLNLAENGGEPEKPGVRKPVWKLFLLTCITALLAVAAGCGSSGSSTNSAASTSSAGGSTSPASATTGPPATLTVASLPILDAAPYFWALDTGMFQKAGLTIKDKTATGGAAALPGLLRGDIDIDESNTVSALLAREKGLPVKLIAGGAISNAKGKDSAAVVVGPKSSITDAQGLSGKTIAVNNLNNIDHIYTEAWLRAKGVDPKSVKFVEVSFPDEPLALISGKVDAVQTVTPFLDDLVAKHSKVLGYPYQVQPGLFISGWLTTEPLIAKKKSAFERFAAVFKQATSEIQNSANHDRLIAILHKRTQLSDAILEKTTYPGYSASPPADELQKTTQIMQQEGLAKFSDPGSVVQSLIESGT